MRVIHLLEPRFVLSDMIISGTVGADVISIQQTNNSTTAATIEVTNGGAADISVSIDGGANTPITPGDAQSFANIGLVALVDLGAGDDRFTADANVLIQCMV